MVIAGEEIRSTLTASFTSMGYCPQADALWEDITLKEHLTCYASIKGIPTERIEPLAE